ncbi:MAG: hypothetical protein LBK42_11230 [Propionibacteriaceae bacterium]|nr:hypothetical protein [Propionibacteriaceae bacterium]
MLAVPGTAGPLDSGSFGWAVLGFFIPLAGLILWLVWQRERPLDSRQARNGFIAGLIVEVGVPVLILLVFTLALA